MFLLQITSSFTRVLLAKLSCSSVLSHFDLISSLASLLTSNLLLFLWELVVEIMMDQFLFTLITTHSTRFVFSPNREVNLIGKPQAQFSPKSQTSQYNVGQVFPSFQIGKYAFMVPLSRIPCLPLRTQRVSFYYRHNSFAYLELSSFFLLPLSPC